MAVKEDKENARISKDEFITKRKKQRKVEAELKAYEDKLITEQQSEEVEQTATEEKVSKKKKREE